MVGSMGEEAGLPAPPLPPPPDPAPGPRRKVWPWVVALVVAPLVLLGSCTAYVWTHSDEVFFRGMAKDDGPAWAGFPDLHGAEVTQYESDCGIDCSVRFVLVGTPPQISAVLDSAGLPPLQRPTEPMGFFFSGSYPPSGLHPVPLVDPVVAHDDAHPDNNTVARYVVRSKLPNGQVQLVVSAFSM